MQLKPVFQVLPHVQNAEKIDARIERVHRVDTTVYENFC